MGYQGPGHICRVKNGHLLIAADLGFSTKKSVLFSKCHYVSNKL